jgi:hypothetical protein
VVFQDGNKMAAILGELATRGVIGWKQNGWHVLCTVLSTRGCAPLCRMGWLGRGGAMNSMCIFLCGKGKQNDGHVVCVQDGMAGLVAQPDESTYRIQCFPLYSLLLAIGNHREIIFIDNESTCKIQCFPLYSLLLAIGNHREIIFIDNESTCKIQCFPLYSLLLAIGNHLEII